MLPIDQIICGDCRDVLQAFPPESIDMVMFSPPYYGLREYGEHCETVWGGDPDCEHDFSVEAPPRRRRSVNDVKNPFSKQATVRGSAFNATGGVYCTKCGAWRGELGLEPTWRLYVDHLVEVCRELKRVLKKTGSMYIVLGDTYAGSRCGSHDYRQEYSINKPDRYNKPVPQANVDLPPKCLIGVPWRVALALIDDGWILRNCLCWHKCNAMPSSVRDRYSNKYEFIFFFVKSRRYYFDLDSIREPHKIESVERWKRALRQASDTEAKLRRKRLETTGVTVASMIPKWFEYTKHDLAVGRIGNFSYTDPLHARAYHPMGKNPGDVIETFYKGLERVYEKMREVDATYDSKYKETPYGQTLQSFQREDRLAKMRRASREVARELFPDDEKLQQDFVNWVHDHAGDVRGKNPGDVLRAPLNSKFLEADLKTASPAARTVKALKEGKLTTHVKRKILEVGEYLKQKKRESGLTIAELSRMTGIRKTTLEHYFRTDFSGQAIPDRRTWDLLKPILNLGDYDEFVSEEVRCALPQPHPLGRNPGDFWSIALRPFKGKHFSVYPPEICVRPILSSSPPGGIVLDPMCGSGTTCMVAKALGRRYIGIDINWEYVEMARRRVGAVTPPLSPIRNIDEAMEAIKKINWYTIP